MGDRQSSRVKNAMEDGEDFKINVEASCVSSFGSSLGVATRDSRELVATVARFEEGMREVVVVEALAMLYGLKKFFELGLSNTLVETDSQIIVKVLQNNSLKNSLIAVILDEIRVWMNRVNVLSVNFCS